VHQGTGTVGFKNSDFVSIRFTKKHTRVVERKKKPKAE
jgi:hypothetical protein